MSWRDRDYHSDRPSDYLANPAAILGFSLSAGRWFGVPVRLHFWLLLTLLFDLMLVAQGVPLGQIFIIMGLLIASLLIHEFSHRLTARWAGGSHEAFVLWPAGGMLPPTAPPRPGPTFAAHVGGIAGNLLTALLCGLALWQMGYGVARVPLNPLAAFSSQGFAFAGQWEPWILTTALMLNWGLILINLLPYYWFDGGYLLQAILWPMLGLVSAVRWTCRVGMVLAVPMALLALMGQNIMGLLFWGLLFWSALTRYRQTAFEYDSAGGLFDGYGGPAQPPLEKPNKRLLHKAQQLQEERRQVDAILDKVHKKGMQSLTEREKRVLQKATERQGRENKA